MGLLYRYIVPKSVLWSYSGISELTRYSALGGCVSVCVSVCESVSVCDACLCECVCLPVCVSACESV